MSAATLLDSWLQRTPWQSLDTGCCISALFIATHCCTALTTGYFAACSQRRTLPRAWSQAPVVGTISHQCYGRCTGCQFVSELFSRSRGWYTSLLLEKRPHTSPMTVASCPTLAVTHSSWTPATMLLVPRTHNSFGHRSFTATGPRVWNTLPLRLRQTELKFHTFRQYLKAFLPQRIVHIVYSIRMHYTNQLYPSIPCDTFQLSVTTVLLLINLSDGGRCHQDRYHRRLWQASAIDCHGKSSDAGGLSSKRQNVQFGGKLSNSAENCPGGESSREGQDIQLPLWFVNIIWAWLI